MDSSKFVEGVGECSSSSESGWTSYIVSTDHDDQDNNKDDGDGSTGSQHRCKKVAEDVDSDDSMASDASSGPSGQVRSMFGKSRGFGHAGKTDEKKCVTKKNDDQVDEKKYHLEQQKAGKGTPKNRANSAGRSKKT